MSGYEGNTPFNKDHRLYSPSRCKSSFGIILFVKIFKIKMLLRVHLNMCLFNCLHTINGILPEGICLWTTFPLRSAFWHYIHHDESWFLVLEPAWITICQRWTRFFLLSLRNPTNELNQSIRILSDCLHKASFDKCIRNNCFFQMCSVAFSPCKRTSLFGYRQHFIIIIWSCSIVPKKQHFSLRFKEVNSKPDLLSKKRKKVTKHQFCYRNNIPLLPTFFPIPNVNANEHSGKISSTTEIEPLSSCSSGWLFNLLGEQLYLVKAIGKRQKKQQQQQQQQSPRYYHVLPRRRVNIPPYGPHARLIRR